MPSDPELPFRSSTGAFASTLDCPSSACGWGRIRLGLLAHLNVWLLEDGIKRIILQVNHEVHKDTRRQEICAPSCFSGWVSFEVAF